MCDIIGYLLFNTGEYKYVRGTNPIPSNGGIHNATSSDEGGYKIRFSDIF